MAHMRRVRTMACILVAMTLMVSLLSGSAFAASADSHRKIIMFDGTPAPSVFNQLAGLGITVLYNLSLIDALAVRFPTLSDPEALVELLLDLLPNVQGISDDVLTFIDPICPTTAPPSLQEYRWGMQQIKAPEAHLLWPDPSQTGAVTVAVLDTGIQSHLVDLGGRIAPGYNAITNAQGHPTDGIGHGTHMAGIITAAKNGAGVVGVAGVEPKIKVAAVKVFDDTGAGYLSVVINGLQWVSNNNGIRLLNMSFGFSFSNPSDGTPLMKAIQSLSNANKIMVASAGNRCSSGASDDGGGSDDCGPAASCSAPLTDTTAPAAYPPVIAVEATDYNGLTPAYSLSGDVRAPGGVLISGAPDKGRILSTNKGSGYGVGHGTSQAAAHVTGAIALALSLKSDLSLHEVRALLGQNLNVEDMINAIP